MTFAKAFLFFFNTIYLGISGLIIYLAVWLIQSYKDYYRIASDTYTVVPAGIIIGVGCLILLTAIVGCCGTFSENKGCLSFFFILLLIAFTMEITAGVMGGVYKNQAKDDVHKGLDTAIHHYNNTNTGSDKVLDFIQSKLHCCGDNSYRDWIGTPYWNTHHEQLPDSCKRSGTLIHTGCYDQLLNKFDDYLTYIIGFGVGFAVLQLFGMITSCFVMCRSGENGYAPLNGGTFV